MADEFGVRYLQAIGSVRRAASIRPRRPSPACATAPPSTACWSARVAAVHEHRRRGRCPGARASHRPAQRRVLRRHLASHPRRQRHGDDHGARTRPGVLDPDERRGARAGDRRLQDRLPGQPCAAGRRASSTASASSAPCTTWASTHRSRSRSARRSSGRRRPTLAAQAAADGMRRVSGRRRTCAVQRTSVSSAAEPVSLHGRRALVLGGSVFVGRHLVDALVSAWRRRRRAQPGPDTRASCPTGSSASSPIGPTPAQMRAALAGRSWDAVFDVSGFVMAAGGSDIEGLLDLLDGHVGAYVYTSSIMAYDQSWAGVFPWTEDQPTNPDGASQLRGLQGAGRGIDPGAARGDRISGIGRPAGGDLRAGQQHLRHGTADVPAAAPAPADPRAARWARRRHVRARRRSVRRDDRRPRPRRKRPGEVFNVSTDSVDVNRYISVLAGVVGAERRRRRTCRTSMLAEIDRARITAGIQPPVRHTPPRRARRRQGGPDARRAVASTCARAMSTPTRGAASEGSTSSRRRSSIRSGRRRGTSISRPRSQDGSVADVEPQGLTDREILRSVEDTVLRVLLPSLRDDAGWARAVAIQLAGLARYAAQRPADATAERVDEIAAVLGGLTRNEIVSGVWSGDTSQRSRDGGRRRGPRHRRRSRRRGGRRGPPSTATGARSANSTTSSPTRRCWSTPSGASSMADATARAARRVAAASSAVTTQRVVDLHRIATGNSRSNWYVEMSDGIAVRGADRTGRRVRHGECRGVRVHAWRPRVGLPGGDGSMDRADGDVLGQPFFVMDFLDGAAEDRNDRSMAPDLADRFRPRLDRPAPHRLDHDARIDRDRGDGDAGRRSIVGIASTGRRPTSRSRCWRRARPGSSITLPRSSGWGSSTATPGRATSSTTADASSRSPTGSSPTSATRWRTGPTWCTMRGARTMSKGEWLELFERVAGVTVTDARPAVLERVQLLQGRLRQPHLSAGVPHGEPLPQHGAHRHGAPPDLRPPAGRLIEPSGGSDVARTDESALIALSLEYADAVRARDAQRWAATWTDDARWVLGEGREVVGRPSDRRDVVDVDRQVLPRRPDLPGLHVRHRR